jgi:hypothetical protein
MMTHEQDTATTIEQQELAIKAMPAPGTIKKFVLDDGRIMHVRAAGPFEIQELQADAYRGQFPTVGDMLRLKNAAVVWGVKLITGGSDPVPAKVNMGEPLGLVYPKSAFVALPQKALDDIVAWVLQSGEVSEVQKKD